MKEKNPDTFKKNLSLYTDEGKYNILAQLLSDDSHMPVRVAIFSGKTKADNMYSVREFGNQCLLYSLDEVLRYGDVLNIIQADETDRIVERKEVPLFENDAFREAVINAFVHNKWVSGNEPMFTVFSDRIEILSRGSLAPGQTMEGFFAGESIPVNKKLSEILLQLHISEKTGRGVPKITEQYGRDVYEFREKSIVVKIPFRWINVLDDKVGDKVGDKEGDKVGDKEGDDNNKVPYLNQTQMRILVEIRNAPDITKPKLAERLKVGKTTVDKGIAALKKYGFIERVGSNKFGCWKEVGDKAGDKESDKAGDKDEAFRINQTQMRILAEIRSVPDITVPKLAERLKVGRTTVDKGIAVLKKNGFIERVGSNKSGYWKVFK